MTNSHPRSDESTSDVRAALVIAHPGHELCLYGWIQRARPRVSVLTNGSGHSGVERMARTRNILDSLKATRGKLFGSLTDRFWYEALLNQRLDFFVGISEELGAELVEHNINFVVGDAPEGFNPTHDVCRLVIDTAVAIARKTTGRNIDNYDYAVVGRPDAKQAGDGAQPLCIRLEPASFMEKLAAARDYFELKGEIDNFLATHSEDAFRTEYLYPVNGGEVADQADHFYEIHGEKRVREGYYEEVIRYQTHVLPVARRLRERAGE